MRIEDRIVQSIEDSLVWLDWLILNLKGRLISINSITMLLPLIMNDSTTRVIIHIRVRQRKVFRIPRPLIIHSC